MKLSVPGGLFLMLLALLVLYVLAELVEAI